VEVMPVDALSVQSYGGLKALMRCCFCAERGISGTQDVPSGFAARPV